MQSLLPNMMSTQTGGTVDARIDYTHQGDIDATIIGFNVLGQYITPGGAGAYASIPVGYADGNGDSVKGLGNIEVGGLFAMKNSPNMDVLLRAGIALDTADDDGSFLVPLSQISPRLTDAYTTGFNTTWGRGQGQIRLLSGNIIFGALAGVDVPVSGDIKDANAIDALLNLAASIGFEQPGFGIGVGLSYIQALGSDTDSDNNSISSFNATIDFQVGPKARVFGALGIPDLDNISDNGADLFAVGGGVRVGF